MKKILFVQPIVSHYRKSIVEEIIKIEPQSEFWGTNEYAGVEPLMGLPYVRNDFKTKNISLFGNNFLWYRGMFSRLFKERYSHIVLSGINPYLLNTLLIFIVCKLFTSKKIYWWSQGKKFKQGFFGKKLRCFFYNMSDGVFLYSRQGRINFMNEGINENKLHVINNCLNYEDYGWMNYDLMTLNRNDDFRILYTGRLSERKKVIILLKAFNILIKNKVKDIYLEIVGEGEQLEGLRKYVVDNHMEYCVNFHGAHYGIDVHKYFLNCDIVVCPGAVGLSIVHALSFGLPFITGKDDPSHSSELELLNAGVNGDYFILDNPESLANKILEWKLSIKKDRNKIIHNCIQTVITHEYMPNIAAQKLINGL